MLFLLLLFATGVGRGEEVHDLYVAGVPVASQQPDEFRRAAREAMVDVLIRVSGNTRIEESPDIRRALAKPETYYFQFSYDTVQPRAQDTQPRTQDKAAGLVLRIHFEPSSIAQLLRDSGFPVWGATRPSVLVWLVVETSEGRTIVTGALEHPAGEALVARARLRGLPVLFPLLDLEDKAQVSVTTLWGGFHDEIAFASRRYAADTILAGRIYQEMSGEWNAHWALRLENAWEDFDNLDLRLDNLVGDAVDRVTDRLAARYAISASQSSVWVEVEAVANLKDYVALSDYLQRLAPVLDLSVERVVGSEIRFRLGTEGTAEQLMQLIGLDQKLLLLSQVNEGGRRVLHYRWLE